MSLHAPSNVPMGHKVYRLWGVVECQHVNCIPAMQPNLSCAPLSPKHIFGKMGPSRSTAAAVQAFAFDRQATSIVFVVERLAGRGHNQACPAEWVASLHLITIADQHVNFLVQASPSCDGRVFLLLSLLPAPPATACENLVGILGTVIYTVFSTKTGSSLVDSALGQITTTRVCQGCHVSREIFLQYGAEEMGLSPAWCYALLVQRRSVDNWCLKIIL